MIDKRHQCVLTTAFNNWFLLYRILKCFNIIDTYCSLPSKRTLYYLCSFLYYSLMICSNTYFMVRCSDIRLYGLSYWTRDFLEYPVRVFLAISNERWLLWVWCSHYYSSLSQWCQLFFIDCFISWYHIVKIIIINPFSISSSSEEYRKIRTIIKFY